MLFFFLLILRLLLETNSTKAVPAFYIYNASARALLGDFFAETEEAKERRDAPGNFVVWLCARQERVVAERIGSRIDLGGLKDYCEANVKMKRREKKNK